MNDWVNPVRIPYWIMKDCILVFVVALNASMQSFVRINLCTFDIVQ